MLRLRRSPIAVCLDPLFLFFGPDDRTWCQMTNYDKLYTRLCFKIVNTLRMIFLFRATRSNFVIVSLFFVHFVISARTQLVWVHTHVRTPYALFINFLTHIDVYTCQSFKFVNMFVKVIVFVEKRFFLCIYIYSALAKTQNENFNRSIA